VAEAPQESRAGKGIAHQPEQVAVAQTDEFAPVSLSPFSKLRLGKENGTT
jgi:hypothetical protein